MNRPHNQCRWCLTRHSPKCSGPRWPVQPLLDVLGSRPVCATLHGLGPCAAKVIVVRLDNVVERVDTYKLPTHHPKTTPHINRRRTRVRFT